MRGARTWLSRGAASDSGTTGTTREKWRPEAQGPQPHPARASDGAADCGLSFPTREQPRDEPVPDTDRAAAWPWSPGRGRGHLRVYGRYGVFPRVGKHGPFHVGVLHLHHKAPGDPRALLNPGARLGVPIAFLSYVSVVFFILVGFWGVCL